MAKTDLEKDMDKLMDSFYRPPLEEAKSKTGEIQKTPKLIPVNERIRRVEIVFGVTIIEMEAYESEKVLRGIILSRISQTCPQCNGEGGQTDAKGIISFCTLCGGFGQVSAVNREKFLLARLSDKKTKPFLALSA